jgi:hypothetical protein
VREKSVKWEKYLPKGKMTPSTPSPDVSVFSSSSPDDSMTQRNRDPSTGEHIAKSRGRRIEPD